MLTKKLVPVLVCLGIAFSLLNSNTFGSQSLIAYFFYTSLATLTSLVILISLLKKEERNRYKLPAFINIFSLLAIYIFIHGLGTETLSLVHYYWIANAMLLSTLNYKLGLLQQQEDGEYKVSVVIKAILIGISILAVTESIIVILQYAGTIPSRNSYFPCTGTWVNPNVTGLFLSFSLFAVLNAKKKEPAKWFYIILTGAVFIILIAILFLGCRSAYIASAAIVGYEYLPTIKKYIRQHFRLNMKGALILIVGLLAIILFISLLSAKEVSTAGRIAIWENCFRMFTGHPVTGIGFGMFEKEYNSYSSINRTTPNDHINMAYNDFIQIALEGGVIAIAIWICFLISLFATFKHKRLTINTLPVIVAFIIVQLTNIGFEAIPLMSLLIIYLAITSVQQTKIEFNTSLTINNRKIQAPTLYKLSAISFAIIFLLNISTLAIAFYKSNKLRKQAATEEALLNMKDLGSTLNNYSSYNIYIGDIYLSFQQFRPALYYYQKALQRNSSPEVFSKCGYCYRDLGLYDSSEYCFRMVQNMQPHRFTPRYLLLKIYEYKRDTAGMLQKAEEIVRMPVKVQSGKVNEIKNYAQLILDSIPCKDHTTGL